jgi:hypothetical protein
MNLWFRPFRDKLPRMEIIRETCKKVREGFALFSAELKRAKESLKGGHNVYGLMRNIINV